MNGQSFASLTHGGPKTLATMQELPLQKMLTFSAMPEPPEEKITYGAINSGMQTVLTYWGNCWAMVTFSKKGKLILFVFR